MTVQRYERGQAPKPNGGFVRIADLQDPSNNGRFWNAYAGAAFNDKGGELPFAATSTNICNGQETEFVQSGTLLHIRRWIRVRSLTAERPFQGFPHGFVPRGTSSVKRFAFAIHRNVNRL
jgi:hypothetical protein